MKIYFATHATTTDNEAGVASGHNDPPLSALGVEQAKSLASKLSGISFEVVCCSPLVRSIDTAKIAFGDQFPLVIDERLSELNYGDLNGVAKMVAESQRLTHVDVPYTNGESYQQRLQMMREFLEEVQAKYAGKNLLIIGHRATQYSLDTLLKGMKLEDAVAVPFVWQPYWEYDL